MNITFMIGNGFDLNLGLNTRYTDFINEYKREMPFDSESVRLFKRDLRKDSEQYNCWANAELAMGQYSKTMMERYGKNAAEVYADLHDDFCRELSTYLNKQQEKVAGLQLKDQFINSLSKIAHGFSSTQKSQIETCVSKEKTYDYSFIVFNYTTIIDDLLTGEKKIGEHAYVYPNGKKVSLDESIREMIHVHGTITDAMVLGVNDITQFASPEIFDEQPNEYKSSFIKREFNAMVEEGTHEKTLDILSRSALIYIYGMSLGETDKIWWQEIYNLMKRNRALRIIIQSVNAPSARLTPRPLATFTRMLRQRLIGYSLENGQEADEQILSRIHITGFDIFEDLQGVADPIVSLNKIAVF